MGVDPTGSALDCPSRYEGYLPGPLEFDSDWQEVLDSNLIVSWRGF